MARSLCPFMGKMDDQDTALAFPSPWNRCFRHPKPGEISLDHQTSYCLGSGHRACPVFLKQAQAPVYHRTNPTQPRVDRKHIMVITAVIVFVLLGSAGFFWSFAQAGNTSGKTDQQHINMQNIIQNSTSKTQAPAAVALNSSTPTRIPSATKATTPAKTKTPTATATIPTRVIPVITTAYVPTRCIVPAGWVPYIVQPGDSMFGLSVTLGVSMNQLQMANCMGNSTALYVGRMLYVPFLPPMRTATWYPPYSTAVPTVIPATETTVAPTATTPEIPTEAPTTEPVPTDLPTTAPLPTEIPTISVQATAPVPTATAP